MVAIALERKVLEALDPGSAAAAIAEPLKNRLDELRQRREEIQELARNADITSKDVSGAELAQYFDILLTQGEMPAMRWLKAQRP